MLEKSESAEVKPVVVEEPVKEETPEEEAEEVAEDEE